MSGQYLKSVDSYGHPEDVTSLAHDVSIADPIVWIALLIIGCVITLFVVFFFVHLYEVKRKRKQDMVSAFFENIKLNSSVTDVISSICALNETMPKDLLGSKSLESEEDIDGVIRTVYVWKCPWANTVASSYSSGTAQSISNNGKTAVVSTSNSGDVKMQAYIRLTFENDSLKRKEQFGLRD